MCAKDLPDDCQQAVVVSGGARSPLKLEEINSLRSAFLQVPDPHAYVAALTDWLQSHSGIFPRSLALTRNALLAVIPFDEKRNLPSLMLTIGKTHKLPSTSYSKHLLKYGPSSQTPCDMLSDRKIGFDEAHGGWFWSTAGPVRQGEYLHG